MPLELVNDVHSRLNATRMRVHRPASVAAVQQLVKEAGHAGRALSLGGGRHAMGGQQFLQGGDLLDLRSLNRILHFDAERGLVTAEAGIQWPGLIHGIIAAQGNVPRWGDARLSPP
jgi:FAD/FMN-containing dehydrogenase